MTFQRDGRWVCSYCQVEYVRCAYEKCFECRTADELQLRLHEMMACAIVKEGAD